MPTSSFSGLRVLSLESRRAQEIGKLIESYGGRPLLAPAVREVPVEPNRGAVGFVDQITGGQLDMVIFMTGAGVRALACAVKSVYPREQIASALNKVTVVARGPKPVAALREMGVQVSLSVPEPNTWRELLFILDENQHAFPLQGCRIGVQEYGIPNPELLAGLKERGARVVPVCVYEWALPEDTGPLRGAVTSILRGEVDVMLVTSSVQVRHLFQVAENMACEDALRGALAQVVTASIGPLSSDELRRYGIAVDIESAQPKMGCLVRDAAEKAVFLLQQKQR